MAPSDLSAIGVFDSGLGGLTVFKELKKTLSHQRYIYLGDNARFPYGSKSADTVVRYACECAQFLLSQQVQLLVVACNTASAAALEVLASELPIPVVGTIAPAVREALAVTSRGVIGVLGTSSTIASNVYHRAITLVDKGIKVVSQPCPLFVPLVENGMLDGEIVRKIIELYLAPLKAAEVDTVILGCTHYPIIAGPISEYLGPHVKVVECSKALTKDVGDLLAPVVVSERYTDRFYVTDDVGNFNFLASQYLGNGPIQAVRIDDLSQTSAHQPFDVRFHKSA